MYSDEEQARLFTALGYAKRIKTDHFGELDYPRPEVWEFHRSKARIKVALAPARTSKSYAGAWDVVGDILNFDRPEKHLIVGPDYDKASKEFNYVADALVHRRDEAKRKYGLVIPEPAQYYNTPKTGRMQIVWPWGAELHAKSAAHFSSVIGESWGVALLSETCELGPEIFYRALRTRCRRFIMPTTPGLKGMWVKTLYERSNEVGEKDVEVFRFPPEANPTYDMDRFKAELRRVGAEDPFFREQFLGEWVFYGGRVFPMFQPEPVERITRWQIRGGGIAGGQGRVCIDMDPHDIPESWKRVAGADFGFRDKTVYLWGAVAPDGTVIIYDEYYAAQRSIREHSEAIWAKMRENGTKRIDDCVREPKGQALQIAHDFSSEFGLWSRPAASADRLSSRLHLQAYLENRPDDGCPSLRIIKKQCPNLVRELLNLHYEDEDPETRREGKSEVWRGEDHAIDACFVAGTTVQTEHGERPIESVRVGDRVWTRAGLRYVTASGCTGVRETRVVSFEDGRELRGTPDHPVWDAERREWVNLEALYETLCAALFISSNGISGGRIRSKRVDVSEPSDVYNLTVEGQPEYFANGVLVHNCRYLLSTRPSPRHKVDEVDKYWNSLNELKRNRRRLARKYSQIGWKPTGGWNGPA